MYRLGLTRHTSELLLTHLEIGFVGALNAA